ncbi:hypothetical protein BaRGS_00006580 [Batillaria attramentaria]|uniref:Uncharacterized protein n=1 Tax=Batillaria attramentaria TaxID=370345 RepID=A0ABD0LSU0_9CAEN
MFRNQSAKPARPSAPPGRVAGNRPRRDLIWVPQPGGCSRQRGQRAVRETLSPFTLEREPGARLARAKSGTGQPVHIMCP